jgi:hypothetical protein
MNKKVTESGLEISTFRSQIQIRDTVFLNRPIKLTTESVHELIDVLNEALRHLQNPEENSFK